MTTPAVITILGLGPGRYDDLTLQAHALLAQAARDGQTVYFRTLIHPTVEPIRQALPGLRIESFDSFYDESTDWDSLYSQIAEQVCSLAAQSPVIYAVPGHPLVGEASVQLVMQMARERGLSMSIIAGLSFLEPVFTTLELDPLAKGTQILDATNLAALQQDEIAGKIIPTAPLVVAQLYNRRLASAVKLALGEIYPDEWRVKLVRAAGAGAGETTAANDQAVIEMPLYELDRNHFPNHLSTLYVPPVDELTALRMPETLRYITMRLRREPDGCPWDRQQTHASLIRYVIEEAYEVVEAIEKNDLEGLSDELGDLLLQVYLHSEIARQHDEFTLGDVYEHVNAKLIRRHPHVFGQVEVENAGQVVQNWEVIKQQERAAAGKDVKTESVLDDVPSGLPALMVAQEYQKRAARLSFDYKNTQQVLAKLEEELQELQEASTPEEQLDEMGDVLFIAARLARALHVDAEEALRHANRKFRRRFQALEQLIRDESGDGGRPQGYAPNAYTLEQWLELWRKAKDSIQAEP
ncbi:MAG TPA: nucleoside triphosphate pyrophosphohydrolase [Ktedonobacteraceae bacterium]|nr:nucleoside triphosphate pyrophosphohydrolase [Ktedonobacteraceae bacterium]